MTANERLWLLNIGQAEKAIQLINVEAEERDPLHAGYKANLALLYLWTGNATAAVRKAREALELNPQHQFALAALIDAYVATENYTGVKQILERTPPAMQDHPRIRARVALSYVSQGDYAKAGEIYRELLEIELTRSYQGLPITAQLALSLGEVEKAIDLMEMAVDLNMWNQFWTASLFRKNEAVKDHPRYLAHLRRMRLDDESLAELHRRMSFD
jgi:tetratricopeptide (TPR) repeat protein